ncbi:hypothetical protein JCM3765_000418 [Sporobolomyces pararoseus]
MSFPSTSSAFSNFTTTRSSFSSFTPTSTSKPHQVSFGSVPGSQPGVLSWGIGMSSANRGGNGWGAATTSTTPTPQSNVQWGSQSPNNRRRRRSDTPESQHDEQDQPQPQPQERIIKPFSTTTTKRARRIVNSEGSNVQDLGKSLASLDKAALLGIFSSLLESHPHLASTVSSLLPPPTLSSTLSQITLQTRQLQSQIPLNSSPSYINSRMRLPLESFVQEMKTLLSIYIPPSPPSSSNTNELYHPTTTMSFLLHSTLSYLSISQSLSSTSSTCLESHLLPNLINSYHVFITRLSIQINQQGKILPISTVTNWFTELDTICCSKTEQGEGEMVIIAKRALEGVRDRIKKEIGWLVGIKSTTTAAVVESMMQSVEGEEEEL